jgi:hypothetical protein
MDDVYAASGANLVEQYGRAFINDLLRFTEGRDRARLVDAIETWKSGRSLSQEAEDLLWSKVYQAAIEPPDDPAEIVRIIKEDRVFREDRILRSFGTDTRSSSQETKGKERSMSEEAAAAARKRVDENSTIKVTTEEGKNPKRVGSQAYDRFALYQDGMTVKEAKEAGVSATDISYDSSHGYIELTAPEPSAEGEEDSDEESAPKKKRKQAVA